MNNIPTRKTAEQFMGEIAHMRYVSAEDKLPPNIHAHRDDYYIFILLKKGKGKILIDFEECEIAENCVLCILPGQVHFPIDKINAQGWFLAVDTMIVKEEYKEIFEKSVLSGNKVHPEKYIITDLINCAYTINRRLKSDRGNIEQLVVRDLLSSYIGMIAEIWRKKNPELTNKRSAVITSEFKSLLTANYRFMKRPSQYAMELKISPIYLYETIKQTTGQSVGNYIRNEIVIQAKRLLFYTNMSVKEIALELGYEDWAYFTRLFTKVSKLSPTQFRKKYLK